MKTLAGLVLILIGVLGGLYVGVWVMLVGGIVQVAEAFKATPVQSLGIALGVVRILFSAVTGWLTFSLSAAFAGALLK